MKAPSSWKPSRSSIVTTRSQSRAMAAVPTVADLQTLITQLQAQVLALKTVAATAAPTAPAATIAATTAVVFAEMPQTLSVNDLIDYSTKRGKDIYNQGCDALDDKALTNGFNRSPSSPIEMASTSTSSRTMAKLTWPRSRLRVNDSARWERLTPQLEPGKTTR
jgi:hypothetical protein